MTNQRVLTYTGDGPDDIAIWMEEIIGQAVDLTDPPEHVESIQHFTVNAMKYQYTHGERWTVIVVVNTRTKEGADDTKG